MGLAASQARLLTITSRLSSVELKQQRIAMDKMRLANDQEGVSEKYTNALNNKTLTISNGGEEIAMNYSTLAAQGYSVMRASDGVIASSAGSSSASGTSANSSANMNANSSAKANTNASNPEIQKWVGQPAPTRPEFDEVAPTAPSQRLNAPSQPTSSNYTVAIPSFSTALQYASKGANLSYNYGSNNYGFDIDKYNALQNKSSIDSSLATLIQDLNNAELTNTAKTLTDAQSKATQTYKMSDMSFMKKNYGKKETFGRIVKTPENEYANSIQTALTIAQITVQNEAKTVENTKNEAANAERNAQYQADLDAYNKNQQEWNTYNTKKAEYDSKYQAQLNQYNIDYTNWVTANSSNGVNDTQNAGQATGSNSGSTAGTTGATGTNATATTAAQELAAQMKNTQFLIQGLLSGYLVLVKDGQQVSLSSATDIIESYDKTDDAAAEAEYNAQMNKINRKEKILDMQAKRLDTEYSALTNEYNSIKTIIDNHTQKDFSYFS